MTNNRKRNRKEFEKSFEEQMQTENNQNTYKKQRKMKQYNYINNIKNENLYTKYIFRYTAIPCNRYTSIPCKMTIDTYNDSKNNSESNTNKISGIDEPAPIKTK